MKQTNWDGKEVLLVEVPEGAVKLVLTQDSLRWKLDPSKFWWDLKIIPASNWQFAFASPLSPTEEEAGEWVEATERPDFDNNCKMVVAGHPDYNGSGLYDTTIESLHSRIKSEGFPHPERVVLLTKK